MTLNPKKIKKRTEEVKNKFKNKLDIPLDELLLPTLAKRVFEKCELKTIGDLVQKTENELRCYSGYGELISNTVRNFVLKPLGLDYKQENLPYCKCLKKYRNYDIGGWEI